ncbi:hypothetical protein L1887_48838 [Cichorium endivia]|uniref:Predicted protein n=1 Tax=Hordeum vulgare subsp. vulgare TaxID=112509 RepID=F2DYC0_HORVV|nr:hypothetical protein L1887_48838 [Cichorium endivia]BAK00092.1 predicted protein [Hordeum vulgare subsp. vulgare]
MTSTMASPAPPSPTKPSVHSAPLSSPPTDAECQSCTSRPYVERIRSPSHILLAIRLLFTDPQRQRDLLTNWLHVPIGITALLVLVWAIKLGMDRAPFRFPSPVIAMLLLFALLLLADYLSTRFLARKNGRKVLLAPMLALLEAPCDFCLRYMSVMFTPSFILIPAREIIAAREIGLITGWFAASQFAALAFPVILHKLGRWAIASLKHRSTKNVEQRRESEATLVGVLSHTLSVGEKPSLAKGLTGITAVVTAPVAAVAAGVGDAERQLTHVQLETARQQGDPYAMSHSPVREHHYPSPRLGHEHPGFARSRSLARRFDRGVSQSPHTRGRSGRPQSAGNEAVSPTFDEWIFSARQSRNQQRQLEPLEHEADTVVPTLAPPTPARMSADCSPSATRRPSRADSEITVSNDHPPSHHESKSKHQQPEQPQSEEEEEKEEKMDAVDRLVERLWDSIPWLVTLAIVVAGLPVFYLVNISLPLFLGINILTFLFSITIVPPRIRRFAHPILTTSILTVLILWGLGAARGWTLRRTLSTYSVDAKYTVLWSTSGYTGPVIGAGDVLFSTLDAGIVSLAIPMYRYRRDLWLHLVDMLAVLVPCSMLSVFVWPTVAGAIGIAPERALAFASRFMSTPLAIELSLTIGADESMTVILVVVTGIVITIVKDPFFGLFGLDPKNDGDAGSKDYLTIGIAMGSTAGAIGASSLIATPRCMAIASLSFVLFGAILLILAAIPPVVDTLRVLAGASIQFTPAT